MLTRLAEGEILPLPRVRARCLSSQQTSRVRAGASGDAERPDDSSEGDDAGPGNNLHHPETEGEGAPGQYFQPATQPTSSPHVNKSGCEDHNVSQSDRTGTGTLLK